MNRARAVRKFGNFKVVSLMTVRSSVGFGVQGLMIQLPMEIRPPTMIVLCNNAMLSKNAISVLVGVALLAATVRLPALSCMCINTPRPMACEAGCCASNTCCATSQQRTPPPSHPLAKSNSNEQTFAGVAAVATFKLVVQDRTDRDFVSSDKNVAHSPAPLALICIRLI